MKSAGDMVVTKGMAWGAVLFCIFAIAPHVLKMFCNCIFINSITIGVGWFGYLIMLGIIFGLVVDRTSEKGQEPD